MHGLQREAYHSLIVDNYCDFQKMEKREDKKVEITLKIQIIPYRESTYFLGMALDIRLTWDEHTDRTRTRAK